MATMKTLNGYGFNATEFDGKTSDSYTAADSAKLGGKAPEYYIQPRNLLDNSDFRNPVNQRGQTSYSGIGYSIDRWMTWNSDSTLTVNENHITITGSNYAQYVPSHNDRTISAFAKNISGNLVQLDTGYDANRSSIYVNIPSGSWEWAALYEGSYTADTLPPYVPKGYAAELAECQRYYIEIVTQPVNGWCYDWGQVNAFVPTPILMRQKNPSVILNTESLFFYIGSTPYNATLIGGESVSNGMLVKYSHSAKVHGQCIMPEFSAKISADL